MSFYEKRTFYICINYSVLSSLKHDNMSDTFYDDQNNAVYESVKPSYTHVSVCQIKNATIVEMQYKWKMQQSGDNGQTDYHFNVHII